MTMKEKNWRKDQQMKDCKGKMFREKRDDAEIRMKSADRALRMIRTLGNAADKKGD